MLPEIVAAPFGHQMNRDARSIGGNQRARLAVFLNLFVNDFLDLQPLHHHFNHPIGVGNVAHIILKIAERDAAGKRGVVKRRGTGFQRGLEQVVHDAVADGLGIQGQSFGFFGIAWLLGNHVEQRHIHTDVGKVRRNARTHDARTQHGHAPDGTVAVTGFLSGGLYFFGS